MIKYKLGTRGNVEKRNKIIVRPYIQSLLSSIKRVMITGNYKLKMVL